VCVLLKLQRVGTPVAGAQLVIVRTVPFIRSAGIIIALMFVTMVVRTNKLLSNIKRENIR